MGHKHMVAMWSVSLDPCQKVGMVAFSTACLLIGRCMLSNAQGCTGIQCACAVLQCDAQAKDRQPNNCEGEWPCVPGGLALGPCDCMQDPSAPPAALVRRQPTKQACVLSNGNAASCQQLILRHNRWLGRCSRACGRSTARPHATASCCCCCCLAVQAMQTMPEALL